MQTLATCLVLIVIIEHFFIMYLEMYKIPSSQAARIFGLPIEFLQQKSVQVLFSNQGLYNGFLATGLAWAYFFAPQVARTDASILFLGFVIIAAIWGAITSNPAILIKQGLPAVLALLSVLLI